ncbi:MAG: hypothetical protein J6K04_02675 [Lachnospiraceae bacterium]|nr:hypothetical protein [Lachnospiraceae bacterium]
MLTQIKRFTPKNEIDSLIGEPLFRIDERLLYYYGNGIVISYTPVRFNVENGKRIKYGVEGIYALAVFHFSDIEMLKLHLRLDNFEENKEIICNNVYIDGTITYDMTFQDIHAMAVKKIFNDTYREGETRRIIDGKMKTVNLFIMHDNYTLFFHGNSPESKVSGFKCVFKE